MEFTTVLFYIFALLLTVSGLKVITSRNPVSAALFLVLAFFNAAAIWMLLQAEFLGILLVLVYVGAVMVLFLFVVMMLDINLDVLRKDFKRFVPMATIVGAIIVIETALILWHGYGATVQPVPDTTAAAVAGAGGTASWSNTRLIGKIIYTEYIFAFEVAGLVLLVAIIAAIALTTRHQKDSKRQRISDQVAVRRQDRVRIVKMKPEVAPAPEPTEPATAATAAATAAGAATGAPAPAGKA
ncbi:NADH-quinone oxidoreductase subunit J [Paraburkholderia sp. SARCC-3016]|uniref:NADH-quinone oxidoreductase subunit J n=1 Tax=Paraburkholderia sp. SARCC-3016 TaxID=3058611 RepID=UPI002808C877|nr:NADH-quinone oxidoreductase subunit J [Paraburkholderia sp. SARCC-3016]MDQ7982441.1 NADH-quinone oxidoreductase subunit J [Paraburkholderia sp. SARCC-3016]